jgi:protein-L-isoaspartate(D-aspartate) O-methyltransferase
MGGTPLDVPPIPFSTRFSSLSSPRRCPSYSRIEADFLFSLVIMNPDLITRKRQLITLLYSSGIQDPRVLGAITSIPREQFLPQDLQYLAYDNRALPISMRQTISQPLMVAVMTQALALTGRERVLEVGTGSGYQTAILAHLAAYVYSIERHHQLSFLAATHLVQLGIQNISLFIGDGSLGWPDQAPYDRILVTAAAPDVPSQLLDQMVMWGQMVIPIGGQERQELRLIQRVPWGTRSRFLGHCVFVPLVGQEAWHQEEG